MSLDTGTAASDLRWLPARALGSVATGAASVLVPLYVVSLGGGAAALGVLAAAAALVGAPGAVVVGRFADRSGRVRPAVLASLAAAAGTLALLPLAASVPAVVALNTLLWLAVFSADPVVTLAAVAGAPEREWTDRLARTNRALGYGWAGGLALGALWTAGAAALPGAGLGPATAQRALFLVCAAVALAALAGCARLLPRRAREDRLTRSQTARLVRTLARGRRSLRRVTFPVAPARFYWSTRTFSPGRLAARFTPALGVYFAAVSIFFAGFAAFFAPLPAFLTAAGFGSGLVFACYVVSSLAAAAASMTAGRLAERVDVRLLQGAALGLRGVAIPAVALVAGVAAVSLAATAGLFVVIGLSWAVVAVTAGAIVTRFAPAALQGEALGVYTATATLAGGVGSLAGGWVAAADYVLAFGLAGGLVVAGAGLVVFTRWLAPRPLSRPP